MSWQRQRGRTFLRVETPALSPSKLLNPPWASLDSHLSGAGPYSVGPAARTLQGSVGGLSSPARGQCDSCPQLLSPAQETQTPALGLACLPHLLRVPPRFLSGKCVLRSGGRGWKVWEVHPGEAERGWAPQTVRHSAQPPGSIPFGKLLGLSDTWLLT